MMTSNRIREILNRCSKVRIAVVGDLMLDEYLCGTASRLSQEAPVPVLNVRDKSYRLGGAANVLRNIAAIGGSAEAFGVAGKDEAAEILRKLISDSGIAPGNIFSDPTRRTTEKLRVMAGSQQIVRIDFENTGEVGSEIHEKTLENISAMILSSKIDAVIFEDYAKGFLSGAMVQQIVDLARKHGIYTSLDPHPGHPMEAKGLSLMTPNRMEAFGLAGVYCSEAVNPVEKDEKLKAVADRVLESWKTEALLITLGAQGMALFSENKPMLAIPTKAREVFDVSGAGDTVIATYTMCIAAGATDAEAAAISNYAAGVVVGKVGTATASVEEIVQAFERDR